MGKIEEASESLARAISLGENDGVTYVALGYCHLSMNRYLAAENAYRMGILLYPESKDARNGLINCLLSTGRYQEALSLLDELLEKDPKTLTAIMLVLRRFREWSEKRSRDSSRNS